MEWIRALIKGNKWFYKLITLLVICAAVLFFYGCKQREVHSKNTADKAVIDSMKLISSMFPEEKLSKQGKYYNAGERKNYYIESIIPGSFVNKDGDELLVVVRRPSGELSHVEGFYNVYMAVFDNSSGKMISGVKLFSVDEGKYRIFDGQGISYIFFGGSTTYQGWSNWYGGLWQAGSKWEMKWPKDGENQEYYDYWENRAVDMDTDVMKILQRKVLPLKYEGQVIPDYTWEYSESLLWDAESGSFKIYK
jgi:hypothetical protein